VEIKGNDGGSAEGIGIARKYMADRPTPFLYRSYDQAGDGMGVLFVETEGPPEGLTSAVRAEVRRMNPNVPIFDVRTMQAYFYETALFEPRLKAEIITSLGTVGLILGVLGLYGVIAYSVAQRTYEIGIRLAVGASNSQVLKMVLLEGLRTSCIASAVGIGIPLALKRSLAGAVSYASPGDPVIYGSVFLLILFVTGAACYIPARRASRVDPNVTLRSE